MSVGPKKRNTGKVTKNCKTLSRDNTDIIIDFQYSVFYCVAKDLA